MYLVILILTFAFAFDVWGNRIPNWFAAISFLYVQGFIVMSSNIYEALMAYLGGIIILIVLFPLFCIGAMGAGDVKLLMILPGFFGISRSLIIIFGAMVIASIFGVAKLSMKGEFHSRLQNLILYIKRIYQLREVEIYTPVHKKQGLSSNQIHFTFPILLSVLIHMGGFINI